MQQFTESSLPPNWAIVRITPTARLWEAVAWSCGVHASPDMYKGPRIARSLDIWDRLGGGTGYEPPSDEFHERVRAAIRHLGPDKALLPVGTVPPDEPENCVVQVQDLAALAIKLQWDMPAEFAELAGNEPEPSVPAGQQPNQHAPAGRADAQPVQRSAHQEQEILRVISELGHDSTRLPETPRGRPGIKQQVRQRLTKFTDDVFNKAWKRLRNNGQIAP